MSQPHLDGFLADIRLINPKININDFFGTRTSLAGLITHLQATVRAPVPMTLFDARRHCAVMVDPRVAKYTPALQRLISVWGRGDHRRYPAAGSATVPDHLNTRAQVNFQRSLLNLAGALRPGYDTLDRYDDNPSLFGMTLGNPFLHRVVVPGHGPLDITARGLLLKSGLAPPTEGPRDNGYIDRLHLNDVDLNAMQGRSVLDVGCGGAIFRAEMEALYGCHTTGIDLNYNHVGAAIGSGQSRYVKSTLFLKMLSDKGVLQRTTVPPWTAGIIDRQSTDLQNICTAYGANLPVNGDIFNLPALARTWDFTVCMFLLCYFDADRQTAAVQNMCRVTTRTVFMHNGDVPRPSGNLVYNQDQIRHDFPGCNIVVKDARTHHIILH